MLDKFTHKWLKIPYTLNVRVRRQQKRSKATLLFIHGIGNSGDAWNKVIDKMPPDVYVIAIDLLGFGESPRPTWALYDAKTQARSVLATYLKLRIRTPVTIIGHSLGALVAIEMTRRYPLIVKSLILCSPPIYDSTAQRIPRSDDILRQMYKAAKNNPERFLRLAAVAMKYNLINESFNLTADNVDSYMAALQSMIINQTSLNDAAALKVPTTILRGTLDPFLVPRNLKKLAKANPNITIKNIVTGHEVRGRYVNSVVMAIKDYLQPTGT